MLGSSWESATYTRSCRDCLMCGSGRVGSDVRVGKRFSGVCVCGEKILYPTKPTKILDSFGFADSAVQANHLLCISTSWRRTLVRLAAMQTVAVQCTMRRGARCLMRVQVCIRQEDSVVLHTALNRCVDPTVFNKEMLRGPIPLYNGYHRFRRLRGASLCRGKGWLSSNAQRAMSAPPFAPILLSDNAQR